MEAKHRLADKNNQQNEERKSNIPSLAHISTEGFAPEHSPTSPMLIGNKVDSFTSEFYVRKERCPSAVLERVKYVALRESVPWKTKTVKIILKVKYNFVLKIITNIKYDNNIFK